MTSMPTGSFASVLEGDLRQLSTDARRSEGFVGWLSGPEHPEIKEAAERALLKLRQCDNNVALIRAQKDIVKPFLLASEVKNTKLVSIALVSIQRMLANNAVCSESIESIVGAMEQVEHSHDEGVLLKLLQTTLTMFQSSQQITEEQVCRMLGVCFRLLSNTRNSDSVLNTAAATVRQAVALVFDHVLDTPTTPTSNVTPPPPPPPDSPTQPSTQTTTAAAPTAVVPSAARAPVSIVLSSDTGSSERSTAALKLLDDLCHLAVGQEAQWVNTPTIPTVFVLDVLDFILSNSVTVFATIPEFEHALLVRICQLLINQLQELLNKPKLEPQDAQQLRVVLRVVRTVVRNFYRQLKQKCGVFIETLLHGVAPHRPLQQRVLILQVFRSWSAETDKLQFLFETYDMRPDCKLKAVERMTACFTDTIDSALRLAGELMTEDPLLLVANLFYTRQTGKSWALDMDFASAPSDVALAYLAMVAIDCLLNVITAMERLVDRAAPSPEEEPLTPGPGGPVEVSTVRAMVGATWKQIHQALNHLLARCAGEVLVLQLLRGYQAMTQSCGTLQLHDARDAFISSICEFALMPQVLLPGASEDARGDPLEQGESGALPMSPGGRGTPGGGLGGSGSGGPTSPPGGRATGLDGTEGLVLTPKNVQALRTLFNIAHRLHATLGPSWVLILDTLHALDRLLLSPSTTTQELSSDASNSSRPSDLMILSTAATQLYESTAGMDDAAVLSLFMGLRVTSQRALSFGAMQPGGPVRLFAVGRMVEVLQHNRHRLPDLWKVFVAHVGEILTNSTVRPAVRGAAADALGRAISVLLTTPPPVQHAAGGILRAAASVDTESMVLNSLEQIQGSVVEQDAALGVLRVCTTVLQHHGDHLQQGWQPLLQMLQHAASATDPTIIKHAFPNMQLICSDYLAVMPYTHMLAAIHVAAMFGAQQGDLNVSLTTISLLWNTADALGKAVEVDGGKGALARGGGSGGGGGGQSGEGEGEGSGVKGEGEHAQCISGAQYVEALTAVLTAMQSLCTDSRPEVRNSGTRTLFSIVHSAGPRLTPAVWERVVWGMLHPLVCTVHHMAATSSREEAEGATLGKGVKMLVHHSRNSEQKQWDETLVLALNGTAKVFKAHWQQIAGVSGLDTGWQELMMVVESSIAGGRKETALAATSMVSVVLMAHAGTPLVDTAVWKRALRALDVGIEAATSPSCMVPLAARLELIHTTTQLYSAHRRRFDAGDLRQYFGWLEKFGRNPCAADDVGAVLPGTLPPVQRAVLGALSSLPPIPIQEVWTDVFGCLLRLLRPHVLEQAGDTPPTSTPTDTRTSVQTMQRIVYSSTAMERVIDALLSLYTDHAPWQVKASVFAAVVQGLGRCMATRYTVYPADLWRKATGAFCAVVTAGLPSVNVAFAEDNQRFTEAWNTTADAFEWFILATLLPPALRNQPYAPPSPSPTVHNTTYNNNSAPTSARSTPRGGADPDHLITPPTSPPGPPLTTPASAPPNTLTSIGIDALPEESVARLREDAGLEQSVLDALTDVALTACADTEDPLRLRLIGVLSRGMQRPAHLNLPAVVTGRHFSHVCLQKLHVLCSRGAQAQVGCLQEVAQLAVPVLLERCRAVLQGYLEVCTDGGCTEEDGDGAASPTLEEVLSVLEVLSSLTLMPPVVNVLLKDQKGARVVVEATRKHRGGMHKERAHLLLLYKTLSACIVLPDPSIRTMVAKLFNEIGDELMLL